MATSSLDFEKELLRGLVVHTNVNQEVISVTNDKLKLSLREFRESLERESAWKSPLGISLATLATIVTADFNHNVFGVKGISWFTAFVLIFIISTALSVGFFLKYVFQVIKNKSPEEYFFASVKKSNVDSTNEPHLTNKVIADHSAKVINVPRGTTQSQLMQLNKLLKSNSGNDHDVTIYLSNGKKITVPYGVNYTNELEKMIDNILQPPF